jgi:hypothetical protein
MNKCQEKQQSSEKNWHVCHSVSPTGFDLGSNMGRRDGKPATIRLSYLPLSPPWIPHNLIWARTRAAAVGSLSYSTVN